ncbi:SDR family oxidoreductase [Martelella mediterranea]|uniref:3-oxoacyl-[acyl-carrier-protein] reductase FabG n=1 Tax=Martelella mediterranea DSM 17316 TaxID=1122214 RepID=A0A1U9YXA1_9HYPH|nr:SDR family oxidoreductase [Martelella mediterranea]AQZ50010.1 3-oxoacyl-[acyl-carrier-protein] reductase FabG [Martelella mediterranea DSM 17316]
MSDILPVRPRVAVITGASGGIGRATAERLAALGASVVIGYHGNREKAEALAAALPGNGHVALRIAIEEADSIAAAADAVEARFGAVDLLVNNGGTTEVVPADDLEGLTDDLFDRITQVNLRGPFAMVRAFRPLLSRGENAAVVNVSSIAARTGVGSNLAYCAAKAGLDALTIGLAKALAPDIRVFSVSPAGVDTGFVPGRPREKLEAMAKTLPLQRITMPDDVARAIIACATLLTSSTGIVVPVDEGRHL